MTAVLLAGGSGGAKLAAGMQELLGESLTVIANTGDDTDALGLHVSPDPDLIAYWLSDQIDEERGWGIRGDTFTVFDRLVELGAPSWFQLSDRDLATCLRRTALLVDGARLTEAEEQITRGLGVRARVLPMCDEPVRTRVRTPSGWIDLQSYLVLERAQPEIQAITIEGVEESAPTKEVREAIASAEAIVIGPSNPVISIGPILAVPGLAGEISRSPAPVVAVSPFVAGKVVKGPTVECMRAIGLEPSPAGVASTYRGLIDGLLVDEGDPEPPPHDVETRVAPLSMHDRTTRREVAERSLDFARALA